MEHYAEPETPKMALWIIATVFNMVVGLVIAYAALSLKNSALQLRLEFTTALESVRKELQESLSKAVDRISGQHVSTDAWGAYVKMLEQRFSYLERVAHRCENCHHHPNES